MESMGPRETCQLHCWPERYLHHILCVHAFVRCALRAWHVWVWHRCVYVYASTMCMCIVPPWFRRQIWVMSWTPANPPLRAPASTRQRTRPWSCSTSAGRWWSSWKAQQGPACQGNFHWEILLDFPLIWIQVLFVKLDPELLLLGICEANSTRFPATMYELFVARWSTLFSSITYFWWSNLFFQFSIFGDPILFSIPFFWWSNLFSSIPYFWHFSSGEAAGPAEHPLEKLQESL